ncbi:MAG: hypothetical protein IJI14_07145 [Anaerolineaceae bacterium]|nr:hypothetical protein [Anaerolineaceae bacterium]
MTEERIREIAANADMIVRGYAFTKRNDNIAVINLNRPSSAMYMTPDGKMLESTMDEIEQAVVFNIWEQDSQFIEESANA